MSATLAGAGTIRAEVAAAPAATARPRDLRLDFVRGLALLMIFIDHVSGNRFAALTLQSMGFADAAEVFVFIAGVAAVLAYRKAFEQGWKTGVVAVAARMKTLYVVHLAMVGGMILIAGAALIAGTGFDVMGKLGLQPLLDDPVQALLRLPALAFLPHYLDIIPLYIVLFATLPLLFAALRLNPLLPVAIAAVIYTGAQTTGINAPSFGHEGGWFLNPFAWLMLFALGVSTAELGRTGAFRRLPRPVMLAVTLAAAGYVAFAFLYAAPWRVFPALNGLVAFEIALESDKKLLSWHRLADIAAKAWLFAVLVPPAARFMATGVGATITRAGRNSLPLFIAGVYLSMLGSITLFEAEGHALAHIGVTFAGVAALLAFAALLERRSAPKPGFNAAAKPSPADAAAR